MGIEFRKPDGDVTTNWDKAQPGPAHWSGLDQDPVKSPDDGEYIRTKTATDDDRVTIEDVVSHSSTTFQVFVHIRAQINDPAATAKIRLELFHSTTTSLGTRDIVGADLGGYGKIKTIRKDWLALSPELTEAETKSLELKKTLLAS